jgi:hypothetical protein
VRAELRGVGEMRLAREDFVFGSGFIERFADAVVKDGLVSH